MPDQPNERHGADDTGRDDWDRHWTEYAASAEQNPAQEFRRRIVLRLLKGVSERSRVLDIGSGTGDLAAALCAKHPGTSLLGLELSAAGVELSRRKVPAASFLQVDLSRSVAPPDEYRAWATHAVCSEVLEHVDDPGELLVNSVPFLAAGCQVVVTVPGGPMTEYDRHIGHRRHFRPDDLAALLTDAGLRVEVATGAGFPVFNAYRLLMRALGRRLIGVAGANEPSRIARGAMRGFESLLGLNTQLSRRGWQIVALARACD